MKSGVTGLSARALDPAAGVFECTCTRMSFPFCPAVTKHHHGDRKPNQTKPNNNNKKKKDHRWRRLTQTSAHDTRHAISGVALAARGLNETAFCAHETLCQTNDLARRCETTCLMNLRCTCTLRVAGWEKKRRSEKQSGNDKYKINLSHKICPQACVSTGRGQRHQSREAPPLASH